MNHTCKFFTDTATLAVFDPLQLKHRVDDVDDWWCLNFAQLEEVRSGKIALVSLGSDGVYQARITSSDLNADEHDYAAEVVANLGVTVLSGKLFVGPGECLPSGHLDFDDSDEKRGILCETSNGEYRVDIYSIHWHDSPRWWTEDHEAPADAPSDLVIVLSPRTSPLAKVDVEPRFFGISENFLFDSKTRKVGPEPGMVLTTKICKGPDGLCLKNCGPKSYQATLIDYSPVEWKDFIRFNVVSVNHNQKTLTGEFLEKIGNA
jgi:hypothetical protein